MVLICVQLFTTPWTIQSARLFCPWNLPGKNAGVRCHFLLQGIFRTQGLNLCLLHCRRILYWLRYQGKPWLSPVMLIFRCFQTLKIWTKLLHKKSEEAKKRDTKEDVESLAESGRQRKFSGYLWDRSEDEHTQRPSVNTQTQERNSLSAAFF